MALENYLQAALFFLSQTSVRTRGTQLKIRIVPAKLKKIRSPWAMTSSSSSTRSDRRLHKPALCSKSPFNLPLCNPERQEAEAEKSSVHCETRPGVNRTLRLVYCSATVCSHLQRSSLLFTLLPSLLATSECEIAASPLFGFFQRRYSDGADFLRIAV